MFERAVMAAGLALGVAATLAGTASADTVSGTSAGEPSLARCEAVRSIGYAEFSAFSAGPCYLHNDPATNEGLWYFAFTFER